MSKVDFVSKTLLMINNLPNVNLDTLYVIVKKVLPDVSALMVLSSNLESKGAFANKSLLFSEK